MDITCKLQIQFPLFWMTKKDTHQPGHSATMTFSSTLLQSQTKVQLVKHYDTLVKVLTKRLIVFLWHICFILSTVDMLPSPLSTSPSALLDIGYWKYPYRSFGIGYGPVNRHPKHEHRYRYTWAWLTRHTRDTIGNVYSASLERSKLPTAQRIQLYIYRREVVYCSHFTLVSGGDFLRG